MSNTHYIISSRLTLEQKELLRRCLSFAKANSLDFLDAFEDDTEVDDTEVDKLEADIELLTKELGVE